MEGEPSMAKKSKPQSVGQTKAWKSLKSWKRSFKPDLSDPKRAELFNIKTEFAYFDYSRQLIDQKAVKALIKLAEESGLKQKIEAMFAGEKINATEGRAVLHIALRNLSGAPILVDGRDVMPEVKAVLQKIKDFSEQVVDGKRTGFTGKRFKNIVAIGIGGSYLGPEYLAEACRPYALPGMTLRFVANVDGTDFIQKTIDLNAEETLFIIISKTFTTAETMKNAETAKQWIQNKLGKHPDIIKKHFVAVSTAREKVEAFGIDPENMFGFWDWVGGRFSATSAVGGVPLSLYLGCDNFQEILRGANWMDQHFLTTPFDKNLAVLPALLDILNINFFGFKTRALLPYSQGLSKLAAHTQQVEMESNGKRVDINGKNLKYDTGEVVFGEPGTNGQHSFYQLIHQGTQIIPCDFIGFIESQYPLGESSRQEVTHHEELNTNLLAQPDALTFGKQDKEAHKNFPGLRPSSTLLLKGLDPFTAGLLLAWTEHRAATKGFIWGINSFDQFGVELGKKLGVRQRERILRFHQTGKIDTEGLNPSTSILLNALLQKKLPE